MRFRLAVLLPAALAACVRPGNPRVPVAGDTATLEVRNDYTATVDVYAVRQGSGDQVRLGQVFSGRTDRLRLDRVLLAVPAGIAFVAVPAAAPARGGAGRAITGGFAVRPGDLVRFRISPDLQSSTASVVH